MSMLLWITATSSRPMISALLCMPLVANIGFGHLGGGSAVQLQAERLSVARPISSGILVNASWNRAFVCMGFAYRRRPKSPVARP
jgi:hypothetical protein